MYEGVYTKVMTAVGLTDSFPGTIGLHQASSLSPYLFKFVMNALEEKVRERALWLMFFADDIMLVKEGKEMMKEELTCWRRVIEAGVLKVSRLKTEYRWLGERGMRCIVSVSVNDKGVGDSDRA
ncbi:uncharacterized protein [Diabrotica undecimpunctata]|uniref:uncharacterized protein n=1 Tax=Diabrotica undecimpunctata TaxID=50387 RepID=UPI003B636A2F